LLDERPNLPCHIRCQTLHQENARPLGTELFDTAPRPGARGGALGSHSFGTPRQHVRGQAPAAEPHCSSSLGLTLTLALTVGTKYVTLNNSSGLQAM
jgi:hypothetical protein